MAKVCEQVRLAASRRRELIGHDVEGPRELADLHRPLERQRGNAAARNPTGRVGEAPEGPRNAPRDQPGKRHANEEQDQRDCRDRSAEVSQRQRGGAVRREEGDGPRRGRHGAPKDGRHVQPGLVAELHAPVHGLARRRVAELDRSPSRLAGDGA